MRKFIFIIPAFITFFTLHQTDAQSINYSGNLLRIPFDCRQVNATDTLKSWSDYSFKSADARSHSYIKYFDHIKTPLRSYFLKKSESLSDYYGHELYNGTQIIETEGLLNNRLTGFLPGPGWDVPEPYMLIRTIITETKNGLWLNNGAFGNAFLFNNDSVLYFNPYSFYGYNTMAGLLKAIVGRVDDKYLAVFDDHDFGGNYNYLLIDPDDSPDIDTAKSIKISLLGDSTFIFNPRHTLYSNTVARLRKITGDLYAITSDRGQGLSILSFSDTAFHFIKTILKDTLKYGPPYTQQWEIRNGKLYLSGHTEIVRYEFNSSDTTFINRRVLLNGLSYPTYYSLYSITDNFGIDRNMKFAAKIFRGPEKKYLDTLKIFDLDKGEFINTVILNGIKDPFMPVVDSPYVYVHQITYQYTGVYENNNVVVKDYKLSAYPNPFNPTTTISYSIPKESFVELKVYDMLGREVSTLVNKVQASGVYKVQFNGAGLASGLYIYSIQAGEFTRSKKLMLVK